MDDRGNAAPAGQEEKKPLDQGAHLNRRVTVRNNAVIIDTAMDGTGYAPPAVQENPRPLDQGAYINFKVTVRNDEITVQTVPPAVQEAPSSPDRGTHINLKVQGQDRNEVFFRIKRSTQLRKLMNAYCDRNAIDFNSIAFLFHGRRLRGEQTSDELEMEDGDEIDAMLHQTGGMF